jgi:hypothetical protein
MHEIGSSPCSKVSFTVLKIFLQVDMFGILFLTSVVHQQGSEVSWARVLEVWWGRQQVFPSCHRPALCYLKRLGYLHIHQPVSFHILYSGNRCGLSKSNLYLNLPLFQPSRHVLHKYANEDVSLGSWFLGLDVEHIDDRRLCCGTPPGNLICICFLLLFVSYCCDYIDSW